jgi:alkanesulfonate monooxygenase SsuD/methylene tetrahydromethanopterin reductase-like flavin-dependent oxidoreductase (luciferase family)
MSQHRHGRATQNRRGFGIVGSLPPDLIRDLAAAAENAGYATFWSNDGTKGEGLLALREAAAVTKSIRLAVGAIPLDRQGPEQIAARIEELRLPVDRLVIGVGSGGASGGLDRVRRGIATLRERTAARLVVAAMGPKMCALAGEIADGVLLDWATPDYARQVERIVADAAGIVGRPPPWIGCYIFTTLGAASIVKLRSEGDYYAGIPSYAAHFARMEAGPLDAAAFGEDQDALRKSLSRYDAVLGEPVVRAVVAEDTVGAYLEVLKAAAPGEIVSGEVAHPTPSPTS